jgi:hypothetical protein
MHTNYRKLAEKALADAAQKYTDHGRYPVIAIMEDGETLCGDCCVKERDAILDAEPRSGWRIAGAEVYWEGPTLQCAHCNAALPSAYGDPDEEDPAV